MASWLHDLVGYAPAWLKDGLVTVGSARLQHLRRSGVYQVRLQEQRLWHGLSLAELLRLQQERLTELVQFAATHSRYYQRKYSGCDLSDFARLPLLEKEELRRHLDEIVCGGKRGLHQSFTGGTTGKAITVYNSAASLQERFAILDHFWELHGFRLGAARTAWFSGRQLIWETDVRRQCFWRNNWQHRVRYYSTFHLSRENLPAYVADLNRFRPAYLAGFPSAIGEVARFVQAGRLPLSFQPQAIFVTSETLTDEQRALFEDVFHCPARNQYAASEGAPFIVECPAGGLHFNPTTGVLEVVDEQGRAAREGEILVTPFYTRETPLIRYRIGDRVKLAEETDCPCGWRAPLVARLEGRQTDYLEIPGRGRIFNSQVGDCVKGSVSILKFQVYFQQGVLHVDLVADREAFKRRDRALFLAKVAERMGQVPVEFHFVADIARSPGGKHSVIKLPQLSPN